MWRHWVNVVLGLYMAVIPFLGLDAVTHRWSMIIGGLVIAVLAAWSAMEKKGGAGMSGGM